MHFGFYLAELMAEHGFCPKELQRRIGVSDAVVPYWLAGKHKPRKSNMIKIANVFETDPLKVMAKAKA